MSTTELTQLVQDCLKVESFDQSAVCSMSLMCTPFLKATELDAPLTECALNISVSIPASDNIPLIQLANCYEETGLCGFTWDRNKGWEFSSVSWQKD